MRHAARLLTKEELTRQLLALVLTAVLVWHTVVIPANSCAPARRPRRRMRGDQEREAESRRSSRVSTGTPRVTGGSSEESAGDSVDELEWPEFIALD